MLPRAALLCSLVLTAACGDSAPEAEGDVHVVVYLVDTLRADRLGLYGYGRATSPFLDELAKRCTVFDMAYAAAPWTLPSVVSMMTSTYPVEHGVLQRGEGLAAGVATLPVRLKELGYTTAGFVCNPYGAHGAGLVAGYDHLPPAGKGEHAVDLDAVRDWLDRNPGKKHFLYLHSTEPHRPYRAPEEYLERFGRPDAGTKPAVHGDMGKLRDLSRTDFDAGVEPGTTDTDAGQRAAIDALAARKEAVDALYDSGVAWADANVGALVSLLEERGMWERTLFVFVSDHGEELFDHGSWLHHQHLYGELVHVPFLIRFPGPSEARRCAAPVSLVDVMPTVLDFLGEPVDGLSGESALPKLVEDLAAPRVLANRVNRMHHYGPDFERRGNLNVAVAYGRWKGIWNVEPDTFELYDLEADPGELDDRAGREPELAEKLRAFASDWLLGRDPQGRGTSALQELDAEVMEGLRALGYAR